MLTSCVEIDVCLYVFVLCADVLDAERHPPFAKANGSLTDLHPYGVPPSEQQLRLLRSYVLGESWPLLATLI